MLLAAIITLASSALIAWLLSRSRGRWLAVDIPNQRSLHTRPTPRTGGLAILAGAATGVVTHWLSSGQLLLGTASASAIAMLVVVALVDDHTHIAAGVRLLIQAAAVSLVLLDVAEPLSLTWFALLLGLVWMINLYNFMDGMDGFAGGMSVFGFGTFALLAWLAGAMELALACAIIVAACGGFLLLNFPPAKLFMGDAGSTVLGLLAGIVILKAHQGTILPVWLGVLVFSPFVVDASITVMARARRGERLWEAHKYHYYQRLVESGWGHRKAVLAEYVLMVGCCASAALAARLPVSGQISIIAGWTVIYAVLMRAIHIHHRHQEERI
jgi:UDP-N-acetylmuramyl pentapeptide phosphotransferase/UDP-N-acetylglucosamine-1-phosphate transferase